MGNRGAAITLLHADLHLDNLVFINGTEPVFLDWARCAMGQIALDLCEAAMIETGLQRLRRSQA